MSLRPLCADFELLRYQRCSLDTFFFFVPTRLVWDNWQRFCGEQKNPGDSTDFLVPVLQNPGNIANGTIFDYMFQ